MTKELNEYCGNVDEDDTEQEDNLEEQIEEKIAEASIQTARKLDYTLESPEERKQLVELIINETPPEQLTNRYLEILADYMIFAMTKEENIEISVFRINAVTGEAAAKSVGTVVHWLHSVINHLAGHSVSFFGNDSCNCTSGGDSYPTFYFHIGSFPFRG